MITVFELNVKISNYGQSQGVGEFFRGVSKWTSSQPQQSMMHNNKDGLRWLLITNTA